MPQRFFRKTISGPIDRRGSSRGTTGQAGFMTKNRRDWFAATLTLVQVVYLIFFKVGLGAEILMYSSKRLAPAMAWKRNNLEFVL